MTEDMWEFLIINVPPLTVPYVKDHMFRTCTPGVLILQLMPHMANCFWAFARGSLVRLRRKFAAGSFSMITFLYFGDMQGALNAGGVNTASMDR